MRVLRRVLVLALVLVVVAALAGATYFAAQLTAPATVRPFAPDNEVVAADDATVTLRDEGFAALGGRWGLQLPGGRHVVLGEELGRGDATVTYAWSDPVGAPPAAGEPVRVDEFVWVGTPDVHGLAWEEVALDGARGPLPAWWLPADGAPVGRVVFVHGRGATREEALRFLPALVGAGWEVLVVSYRGDAGTATVGDRVLFGTDSFDDVAAALRWRADDGLPQVLFGVSMGGAVVGQLLDRAPEAALVDGVVLDSPVLSLDELLVLQGGRNGVPGWANPVLLPLVQRAAEVRYGFDTDALEQAAADGTFDLPVLLVHSADDDFVPVDGSDAFAGAHPGATYLRRAEAGHVRTWNVDRTRYEQELAGFLAGIG